MTTNDELAAQVRAALDASSPGEWEWHHRVSEPDTHAVIGYDGLRTWKDGYEEDVLMWRKDAWIAVTPTDAELIENAPDWLRALLDERERLVAALTEIANHELDKRWWPDISDHAIAQDCELAHDALVARARLALEG